MLSKLGGPFPYCGNNPAGGENAPKKRCMRTCSITMTMQALMVLSEFDGLELAQAIEPLPVCGLIA